MDTQRRNSWTAPAGPALPQPTAAKRSLSLRALPAPIPGALSGPVCGPFRGLFSSVSSAAAVQVRSVDPLGSQIRDRAVEQAAFVPASASLAPVRWITRPHGPEEIDFSGHRAIASRSSGALARQAIESALRAPRAARGPVLDQALANMRKAVSEGHMTVKVAAESIFMGWQTAAGAHGGQKTDFIDILAAMRRVGLPSDWFERMLSVRDQEPRAHAGAWCGDRVRQAWVAVSRAERFAVSDVQRTERLTGPAPLTPRDLREIVKDACGWRERPLGETIAHIVTKLRIGMANRSAGGEAIRTDTVGQRTDTLDKRTDTLDQRTVGALLDGLLDFAASDGAKVSAREAVGHLVNQLRLELHAKGEFDNFLGALRQRCAVRGHGQCAALASLLDERCAQAASDRMRTLTNAQVKRPAIAMAAARLVERARNESAAVLALRKAHGLHQPPPLDRKISAELAALCTDLSEVDDDDDGVHETLALLIEKWNSRAMRRAGVAGVARRELPAARIDRKHLARPESEPVEIAAPRPLPPVQPVEPDTVRYVNLRSLPNPKDLIRVYKRYPDRGSAWQTCMDRVVSPALLPMRHLPAADLPNQPMRSWHEDLAWCVGQAFATPDRPVGRAMLFNLVGELSNNLTKAGDCRLDDSMVDVFAAELFKASMAAPPDKQAAVAAERIGSLMDAMFPVQPSVEMLVHGLDQLLDSMRRMRVTQAISPGCLAAMMAEVVRRTGGAAAPAEVLRFALQPVFWGGFGKDDVAQVLRAVVDALRGAAPDVSVQERFFGAVFDCYQGLGGIADRQAFEALKCALESVSWFNPPPLPGDTTGLSGATLAALRRKVTTHLLGLHHREPDHLGRILQHWAQVCERNARVMALYAPATQAAMAANVRGQAVDPLPGIVDAALERLFDPDQVERFGITRSPVANGPWRGWSSAADFEAAMALPAVLEMVERSPRSDALMANVRRRFGEAIPGLPADRVEALALTWAGAQLQVQVPHADVLRDLLNLLRPTREEGAPPLFEPLDAPRTAALVRGFMRAWVDRSAVKPIDPQKDGRALLDGMAPDLAGMPNWKAAAVALGIRGVVPAPGPASTPKDARQLAWLEWASVDLSEPQLLEPILREVIGQPMPARNKRALVAMLTRDRLMDLTDDAFKAVLTFMVSQSLQPTPAKGQARLLSFCRNLRDHTGLGFVRDGRAVDTPLWVLEDTEERMKKARGRVKQVLACLEPTQASQASQASRELVDFSRRLDEALELVPPPPPALRAGHRPVPEPDGLVRAIDFSRIGMDDRKERERKHSATPLVHNSHPMVSSPVIDQNRSAAAWAEQVQSEQVQWHYRAARSDAGPIRHVSSSSTSTS